MRKCGSISIVILPSHQRLCGGCVVWLYSWLAPVQLVSQCAKARKLGGTPVRHSIVFSREALLA
jgi:hypothetical protein